MASATSRMSSIDRCGSRSTWWPAAPRWSWSPAIRQQHWPSKHCGSATRHCCWWAWNRGSNLPRPSSRNRRIGVLATPATLSSPRFAALVERHAPDCNVLRVPCPGLAAAIERGEQGRNDVAQLLDGFCRTLTQGEVDTVVLGCTHYPFVSGQISARLPADVVVLDTADAVARQAMRLHPSVRARPAPEPSVIRLQSTGELATLESLARSGLGLFQPAEAIAL